MANLKQLQAALARKEADLDAVDEQIMDMPEMSPEAPEDMASPEFDLLSEKREELEQDIREMREGVELISQWEKFKEGPWSDRIKGLLGEIDVEVADIAGDEVAAADDLGAAEAAPLPEAAAPAAPAEALPAPEEAPLPEEPAAEPMAEAAPLEPPVASKQAGKPPVSKKNSYQPPVKKGVSARSDSHKEGSNMANSTPAKASVKEKLAEVKSKRETIRREAQQRVAAAWTIAKTMLPTAPAEVQKNAAANLLQNSTRVLNAMLRQTAKNAHYSKVAETFKEVHKVEMNDLLEKPEVLASLKSDVASEIAGDPKNAAAKTKKADDRKDAGPQTEVYNDGRGCGGGQHTEPKPMDAGSSASETEAAGRPEHTVNMSEGDSKAASKKATEKKAGDAECPGCAECAETAVAASAEKVAVTPPGRESQVKELKHHHDIDNPYAVAWWSYNHPAKKHSSEEEKLAALVEAGKLAASALEAKAAAAKTADDEIPEEEAAIAEGAEQAELGEAEQAEDALAEAEGEEAAPEAPAEMPMDEGAEADTAGEVLSDEKKMVVEEKIEEAQEAIKALEQEILEEGEEELDLAQVFNEEEMEDKVSSLANEGEKSAGNGEEYFEPSAAESMEASLDDTQVASMEDFFSLQGSDSDPLAHLIAGEVKSAAEVAGMNVVPSFTGEAARHFESDTATGENRDNENDHEGDLFAEAIEDQKPEDGGFKRVKQDDTNVLQAPKSAKKTASAAAPAKEKAPAEKQAAAPVIKKLKNVTASEPKPFDIASALLGDDEI